MSEHIVNPNLSIATSEEDRVVKKAARRIIPFLTFCFFLAFLDRVNIGFASLQMNDALHLGPAVFGLAGGLFFVSYFIFEVPSNMLMDRFGARRWLARIMIVWGIVAMATALVQGANSFLVLRLLLGAAEAGFFPGVILYLTRWFPRAYRAKYIGWFSISIPLSGVVGSPLSAALLSLPNYGGIASWQWLFIVEGLPTLIAGIACLFLLADRPETASWLSASECATLRAALARDHDATETSHRSVLAIIFSGKVLWLALILSGTTAISAAYAVWLPRVIKSYHWSTPATGWLTAILFLCGTVAMVYFANHSDKTKERRWHTALPLIGAALASLLFLFTHDFFLLYLLLALAVIGIYACKGAAWAMATEWLPPDGRAASLAQVNALSNLAGFATISLIGIVFQKTTSYPLALLPLGALALVSALAALAVRNPEGRSGSA